VKALVLIDTGPEDRDDSACRVEPVRRPGPELAARHGAQAAAR
jgi:hypothetical protein